MNLEFKREATSFVSQNEEFMKALGKSLDPMDQALYRKFMEAAGRGT